MKLEYLFDNKDLKKEAKKQLTIDSICPQIQRLDGSEYSVVSYSIDRNSMDAAKVLSRINISIRDLSITKGYKKPMVLQNESSAYFNKMLYPVINTFERDLRKLLYLVKVTSQDEELFKNIYKLEEQNFSSLSTNLFKDRDFIRKVKGKVGNKDYKFTKSEILDYIDSLDESICFKNMSKNSSLKRIQEQYKEITNYRNDIMHAHNIDFEKYNKIKKTYEDINVNLENEIDDLLSTNIKTSSISYSGLIKTLDNLINQSNLVESLKPLFESVETMNEIMKPTFESIEKFNEKMKPTYESIEKFNEKMKPTYESIEKFNEIMKPTYESIIKLKGYKATYQDLIEDNNLD